ncbi:hypothetical protein ACWCQZ_50180 [Streptomyces sp. NPDC002285]
MNCRTLAGGRAPEPTPAAAPPPRDPVGDDKCREPVGVPGAVGCAARPDPAAAIVVKAGTASRVCAALFAADEVYSARPDPAHLRYALAVRFPPPVGL